MLGCPVRRRQARSTVLPDVDGKQNPDENKIALYFYRDFCVEEIALYIHRHLEGAVLAASGQYPVIMVCGQRQVGKSTMLHHIKEEGHRYVTLDDAKPGGWPYRTPPALLRDLRASSPD